MAAKKILVAHDFSDPANRALAFAADLADKLGASLEVVHVHPDVYDGQSDPSLGLPWPMPDQVERYMRFLETEIERAVRGVLGDAAGKVKHYVVRGDPAKRVLSTAADIGADMLCIGSTGKGAVERALLGSVSQRVVRTSEIPVLTVH
jgi:nucleotide-binding universal stress UspA family protein